MRQALIGVVAVAVACATPAAGLRLGQRGYVDGPVVTPLRVIADSRCPTGVACVWAGTVELQVRVTTGPGSRDMALRLGEPVRVADGMLTLVSVLPVKTTAAIPVDRYRFIFRFDGGL